MALNDRLVSVVQAIGADVKALYAMVNAYGDPVTHAPQIAPTTISGNATTSKTVLITNFVASYIYSVVSSDPAVATASVSQNTITVTFAGEGTTTITLSSKDPNKPYASTAVLEVTAYSIYGVTDDVVQVVDFAAISDGHYGYSVTTNSITTYGGSCQFYSKKIEQDAADANWNSYAPEISLTLPKVSVGTAIKTSDTVIQIDDQSLIGKNIGVVDTLGNVFEGVGQASSPSNITAIPAETSSNTGKPEAATGNYYPNVISYIAGILPSVVGFCFSPDGLWYLVTNQTRLIRYKRLSKPFDLSSLIEDGIISLAGAYDGLSIGDPTSICMSHDGTRLYVSYGQSRCAGYASVSCFALSTPFDVRTFTHISSKNFLTFGLSDFSSSFCLAKLAVTKDKSRLFFSTRAWTSSNTYSSVNDEIRYINLQSNGNLPSSASTTTWMSRSAVIITGMSFTADGRVLVLAERGVSSSTVYANVRDSVLKLNGAYSSSYSSTHLRMGTATGTTSSHGVSGDVYINPEGTKLFAAHAFHVTYGKASAGLVSWEFPSVNTTYSISLTTPMGDTPSRFYGLNTYVPELRMADDADGLYPFDKDPILSSGYRYEISGINLIKVLKYPTTPTNTRNFRFLFNHNNSGALTISKFSVYLTKAGQ